MQGKIRFSKKLFASYYMEYCLAKIWCKKPQKNNIIILCVKKALMNWIYTYVVNLFHDKLSHGLIYVAEIEFRGVARDIQHNVHEDHEITTVEILMM